MYWGPQGRGCWVRATLRFGEREGASARFIGFLKQIVSERILLPNWGSRNLGVSPKYLADGLPGTQVGAEQQVLRALQGP